LFLNILGHLNRPVTIYEYICHPFVQGGFLISNIESDEAKKLE